MSKIPRFDRHDVVTAIQKAVLEFENPCLSREMYDQWRRADDEDHPSPNQIVKHWPESYTDFRREAVMSIIETAGATVTVERGVQSDDLHIPPTESVTIREDGPVVVTVKAWRDFESSQK